MRGEKTLLLPKLNRILEEMGENIKLARLRRKLITEQPAEREGISRSTLWQVEKGLPSDLWEPILKCCLSWDWKRIYS
jgi:DNA-binding XRE family transcriptional regulator